METFAFYDATVGTINLLTHWVTKKDCLNLIFVKDIYFCKKGARNGRKMVIYGVTTRLGESDFI